MAIAIRGTTPLVVATAANPISGTLTGARQPQSGDVLLIIHGNDYYALSNMPTPTVAGSTSGVNAISGGTADSGSLFAHAKSYTYVVGSTGDLAVSVTETGAGDEEKVLVVYVLSGVDTSTPTDGTPGTNTDIGGATTNRVCNATSPSSSDAFLVVHTNDGNGSNSVSYTPPAGMAEQYDGSLAASMGYSGATLQLVASGSTGTKTFTTVGNASYCTLTIAVKTAAAGGTPVEAPPANFDGPAPGLFNAPNSFPQPWAGTDSSTMQVDAQTGLTATAASSTGTAAKVVTVTGRCAAAAFSRGAAAKTTAQTGSAAGASASTAVGKKVAPQAGPAATATRTSGTAVKVAPQTGSTAAVATSSGNLGSRAETGRTYATGTSTATAVKVVTVTGRCATASVARATAVKRTGPQGIACTASTTRATIVKRATPVGSAATAAASSGACVKRATATGRTFAVAVALKVSTTRNVIGYVWAATASFPRHNPSSRPGSGSTARPGSGDILRPYTGVIHRP